MTSKVIILLAFAGTAAGQNLNGAGIAQSMKQNSEMLKRYSYKRRTEIKVKDKSRGARVDLVRYVDGKIETVPIEAPPRPEQSGRGGLRGRMIEKKIEKKKEEMKEDKERLEALLRSYLSPGSDTMRTVFEKATISRLGTGPDADVKIVANGVKSPSDSFTVVWSVANRRPASIAIHAVLDGKPVQLTADYSVLPNGPFYAARTTISMPKKDLMVTIDNFDYTLSGDAK